MTLFQHSHPDTFVRRHIGPSPTEINEMLETLGYDNLSDFTDAIIPDSISMDEKLNLPPESSESETLSRLKNISETNKLFKNYLKQLLTGK